MKKKSIRTRTAKAAVVAGLCLAALAANAATVSVDCDAGNSISRAAKAPSHAEMPGASAALWRSSSQATIVPVANATAPR